MTILHILDHSQPLISGYSTRSRHIVEIQRDLGLRPVVLTSPKHPSTMPLEVLDGIRHYRSRKLPDWSGKLPYAGEVRLILGLARRIIEVAKAERARILHAHSPVLNGLPALWAARKLGIPVVYELRAFWEDGAVDHGTTPAWSLRYRLSRALETFLLRRVDHGVTIAEAMRREIAQRGVAPNRLTVVPNGVDVDWFRPVPRNTALASSLGLDGDLVLGFIGSFYRYEGLRFLLDAMPLLRAQVPKARLLLVGAGEDEAAVRAAAARADSTVVFAGQVAYREIRSFYSLLDVFVCPRRRMRLTELVTPLKPLEAMAMGRPVLASDVGGLTELVRPEVTGVIFAAEDPGSFVDQATRLADRELRQRVGVAARKHVEEERSWRHIVSRYVTIYDALDKRPLSVRGGAVAMERRR